MTEQIHTKAKARPNMFDSSERHMEPQVDVDKHMIERTGFGNNVA